MWFSRGSPDEGKWLARRPRHTATLSADWSPGPLRVGADLRLVSRAFDEASGIDHPVIWTAERDREMWAALQG